VTFSVRQAEPAHRDSCVAILQQLPDYFTPNTHDELRQKFSARDAWVAVDREENTTVGFVLIESRYIGTAEITFAAVLRERHGSGIGTALVEQAFAAMAERKVVVVEVKTLDASAGYKPYEATRAFWQSRGFRQIDCIDPLPGWPPGNPAAIYAAALTATR
jgi:ribosomal protein S18 acetylase RimI-like enzyme